MLMKFRTNKLLSLQVIAGLLYDNNATEQKTVEIIETLETKIHENLKTFDNVGISSRGANL